MAVKKRSRGKGSNIQKSDLNSPTAGSPKDGGLHPPSGTAPAPLQLDPREAARLVKNAPVDPSTQIVRHLAIFRLIIFLLLVYTYVKYLPHSEVNRHVDSWLTYDQFQSFYDWAPKQGQTGAPFFSLSILTCAVFFGMLSSMGGVNGILSFQLSAVIFLSCFAFRFFLFAHSFTDRHYLLFLLGIITAVSGGGSFFLIFTEVDTEMSQAHQEMQRRNRQLLIQSSEWGAITLRLQFAVVYLFSSFWKLHVDYFQGHILRSHVIGLDNQGPPPTWFWRSMNATFGNVAFQIFGMVYFLMDFGMFLVLTFRRPTDETSRSFVIYSALFHAGVAWTIGHKLGYSFSLACLTGLLIFYPIGGGSKVENEMDSSISAQSAIKKRIRKRRQSVEANLIEWVHRYATGSPDARATRQQQLFTLAWLLLQIALPLRMPLISGGSYALTSKGYRFSWTMMLHTRQTTINHVGKYTTTPGFPSSSVAEKLVPLHLFYVIPECSGKTLQRRDYMPERAVATEDPRTLPIDSVLTERLKAFVRRYPRYIARVASGMSMLLNKKVPLVCGDTENISIYGVHFAKLNGRGAYYRTFDPTIDLAQLELSRQQRPIWEKLWDVAFDAAMRDEFILASGIGTMDIYIDKHSTSVGIAAMGAQRVEYIADRAACLFLRPLALWPNGYPLAIMPLEVPQHADMLVTARMHSQAAANTTITAGNQWDILEPPKTAALKLGVVHTVTAVSLEVSTRFRDNFKPGPRDCANSGAEDTLFALFFMS